MGQPCMQPIIANGRDLHQNTFKWDTSWTCRNVTSEVNVLFAQGWIQPQKSSSACSSASLPHCVEFLHRFYSKRLTEDLRHLLLSPSFSYLSLSLSFLPTSGKLPVWQVTPQIKKKKRNRVNQNQWVYVSVESIVLNISSYMYVGKGKWQIHKSVHFFLCLRPMSYSTCWQSKAH